MLVPRISVTAAIIAGSLAGIVHAQMFTGIGHLADGYETSHAQAVSDNGVVVGFSSSPGMNSEAFRWSFPTGMVGLGALGTTGSGVTESAANGVSSDGQVVEWWLPRYWER